MTTIDPRTVATSWAPDQQGTHHALADGHALHDLRSLCGLRVDVDQRLVIRQTTAQDLLHISTVRHVCRSCVEKLGGGK